ncbi:MAG TPA: flavin reductase family protein [Casimicrobiaceae bacterium]|nr:flavin reductase family protein [Casimicrobiaceae bacterium]
MDRALTEHAALTRAFGQFATGVVMVVAETGEGERAMACARAFNSVSLDPPLLLWSLPIAVGRSAPFSMASRFTVHVLGEAQENLIDMANAGAVSPPPALGDGPVLDDCCAWFMCDAVEMLEQGDHAIFIARITRCGSSECPPLVQCGGEYVSACSTPALVA